MFGYYLHLALRSLRRNVVLTLLMIAAIAVGIGASMTTLTVFRAMSADPIPEKSDQLFTPQIDNYGPAITNGPLKTYLTSDQLPLALTYTDAMALMQAHAAERQAPMYGSTIAVIPSSSAQLPFQVQMLATGTDFFPMFDVPFEYGAPWSAADDEGRAPDVVLSRTLNDRLFGGSNSVGRQVSLNGRAYSVTGVIRDWELTPRFYGLFSGIFGNPEQLYMPFNTAIAQQLTPSGDQCLSKTTATGKNALLHSECVWISFWAELPTAEAASNYRAFLTRYAAEQRRIGRFNWPPRVALRNVRQWLAYIQIVSNDVHVLVLVSFAFLLVCLLNSVGLMLAKFMARSSQVCIRRALGADAGAIVSQCLVEAAVVGLVGGLVGIGLAVLGLTIAQGLFAGPAAGSLRLTQLEAGDVVIALALAVGATLLAGLYPTWRATRIAPAWQLKIQ
ncbi:MAG: ABC transporter permease [Acetobacteraceae bacterium]